MEESQKNAMAIAKMLETHPLVEKVVYPGLKSYKYYDIAKAQTKGPGAMIALYIKGGLPVAGKFLQELKVFALAVSLGAVESLACSPAIMTHAAVPVEKREAIGLTDSLIRLSVGIENGDDLVEDLKQALDKAQAMYEQQGKK
jgi:cystathionine gamma-lyase